MIEIYFVVEYKTNSELFKQKFKKLMNWAGRWVTKENMELALELAKKFAAKYRKTPPITEKDDTSTTHIIDGDETVILVPKEV